MATPESATPAPVAAAKGDNRSFRLSPPPTACPSSSPTIRPGLNRVATRLSPFLNTADPDKRNSANAPFLHGIDSSNGMETLGRRQDPFATMSPAKTPDQAALTISGNTDGAADVVDSDSYASQKQEIKQQSNTVLSFMSGFYGSSASLHTRNARPRNQQYEPLAAGETQIPVSQIGKSTSAAPDHNSRPSSLLSSDDARPLRTASVRADTKLIHPKPIAHPPALSHAVPDKLIPSCSAAGNIAQLEATAERLSMTSSIDDAIRDLHGELKRCDSRRSAKLALATMASVDEYATSLLSHLGRHISTSASIVSTNTAARLGGYSPAGFVMSPNTSLTSRLRSGSSNSVGIPDASLDSILSRNNTGKSSTRSVRSSKLSLAEISELEPVSLNQKAFDEADAAPPLEQQSPESLQLTLGTVCALPSPDASHEVLDNQFGSSSVGPYPNAAKETIQGKQTSHSQRSESVHSNNTSEQGRDAFIDFDGVHCEPQDEEDLYVPEKLNADLPTPRPVPTNIAQPTPHTDLYTGTKMLYYPARVPAMLNLPPKLSSKPKTAVRDQRRSQVLSAMMDANVADGTTSLKQNRQSMLANFGLGSSREAPVRESWLPDPVADHRNSFAALTTSFGPLGGEEYENTHMNDEQPVLSQQQIETNGGTSFSQLRRPERLSKPPINVRKSMASVLGNLPPQLRASAFFDLPSAAPEIEMRDGSAMATLDSILDASASAPVSAFTDHLYIGKLGSEVCGMQTKQHKTRPSVATVQALVMDPQPKKRLSMMWLGKQSSSYEVKEQKRPHSSLAIETSKFDDDALPVNGRVTPESVNSAERVMRLGVENEAGGISKKAAGGEEDDIPKDDYFGPPTTLLAELQLRKQQQKQRVRNLGKGLPNSNYATLLEMDTVAEAQRKTRQNKRVNLAWEGADAHIDQNGSDDEDVPLAIVAAMQRGAKNWADFERPLGLMERREMEDNEPLSHRRARLQGVELPPSRPLLNHRHSMMCFPAARSPEVLHHNSETVMPSPEPRTLEEVDEIEEETLESRRRRLATKDGALPKARPVSGTFLTEILNQFPDTQQPKPEANGDKKESEKEAVPSAAGEAETLGQRRKRLQVEREARDQEMGLSSMGKNQSHPGQDQRPLLSLSNVLSAHPKRESGTRLQEERLRQDAERRAVQDRDNKLSALRTQMPSTLPRINIDRSGGFLGGAYNDGTGGLGAKAALSSPAVNTYGLSANNRSGNMNGYGAPNYASPLIAQQTFGPMHGCMPSGRMGLYNTKSSTSLYNGRPASQMYGGSSMTPVQASSSKSMDRVEQWRYGVRQ